MPGNDYPFFSELARTLNSGQSRSVVLAGAVHDLYFDGERYVPLVGFLLKRCAVDGIIQIVYELNGPLRIHPPEKAQELRDAWIAWKSGEDPNELVLASLTNRAAAKRQEILQTEFDSLVREATGSPAVAMEFLRQLTVCSRARKGNGQKLLPSNLLIFIEAADLLLPGGDEPITRLNVADRHRVTILRDWFSDAAFQEGSDSVVLLSESVGGIHRLITSLPQVLSVSLPDPDAGRRRHYVEQFIERSSESARPTLWGEPGELAEAAAGLSIQSMRQLLLASVHMGEPVRPHHVIEKVARSIAGQLGEDVVEFKLPGHDLDDVVGNDKLKGFLREELIPRLRSTDIDALPGAAVAGPIGGGKTFIFEAVAKELGVPVLTLKNIRSQWYGQTDVIFEKLRRVLMSLGRVVIFVDEADTQFGGVGEGAHETERRLTGKVQQMMSDPLLRGKVSWLLMTARIHLLSPDIRRPGRVGDLIIPVLDPEGDDRRNFIRWMIEKVYEASESMPLDSAVEKLDDELSVTSAAGFAALRSRLKAKAKAGRLNYEAILEIAADFLPPAIEATRRYQTLQALINCTRRSLLPDPSVTAEQREMWQAEVRQLEARGVS